jgi:hypothetical protein
MQTLDPHAVTDRESFVQFVEALIEDRAKADEVEAADPERYRWGGANNWQNSSIASYLECSLAGATAQRNWGTSAGLSWGDLALFLWFGKIYE